MELEVPTFITHYHYPDKAPFLNLSDLPEEERNAIVKELNQRAQRGESQRTFPDWYFVQRREAEKKLRELYIQKGGQPKRNAPHYFVLGKSPIWEDIHQNFKFLQFNISEIETELYFSIGDSLWTMAQSQNPDQKWENKWYQGKLYDYQETCEILNELKVDLLSTADLKRTNIAFVETFLWSDEKFIEIHKNK